LPGGGERGRFLGARAGFDGETSQRGGATGLDDADGLKSAQKSATGVDWGHAEARRASPPGVKKSANSLHPGSAGGYRTATSWRSPKEEFREGAYPVPNRQYVLGFPR